MKSGDADHYLGIQNQFLNRKLKGYPSVIFLWDFREVKKKSVFWGVPPPKICKKKFWHVQKNKIKFPEIS
jgi:hypothetical protein